MRAVRTALVALTASAMALTAACTASSDSEEPASRDLTVAVASLSKENIDPSQDTLTAIGTIGAPIYDWLVWPDKSGKIGPGLAKSWTEAADHKSWTITLRDDATFSDGTKVTAEDVKFSIELHLKPEATSSLSGLWRSKVTEVVADSPTQVTVKLNSPWPTFPDALSPYEGAQAIVLPKAYYEKVGADGFRAAPVGTGPWKFVKHDLGVGFSFTKGGPSVVRSQPGYDNLNIKLVTEPGTRVSELLAGSVQMAEISPDQVAQVRGAGLQVLEIPDYTDTALTFFGAGDARMEKLPVGDVNVRKALALAINREELLGSVLAGYGKIPARFIIGEDTLGYNPAWTPEAYNVEEAKRLLAEAGYPQGFEINIYSAPIAGAPWIPRAVEAIAGYWNAIGVKANITPTDYGTVSSLYRQRPLPDQLIGSAMINVSQLTNTNATLLNAYYPSSGVVYLLPTPEMDRLSGIAGQATTTEALGQAITQMVDYANSQYVAFPLARTPALLGAATSVQGWDPYRSGWLGMQLTDLRPKG